MSVWETPDRVRRPNPPRKAKPVHRLSHNPVQTMSVLQSLWMKRTRALYATEECAVYKVWFLYSSFTIKWLKPFIKWRAMSHFNGEDNTDLLFDSFTHKYRVLMPPNVFFQIFHAVYFDWKWTYSHDFSKLRCHFIILSRKKYSFNMPVFKFLHWYYRLIKSIISSWYLSQHIYYHIS